MKKLKKISAVLMAMALAFGLFSLMPAAVASAAEFTVNNDADLTEALASADTEIVINIGANILYDTSSLSGLSGKIITINLQGNEVTGYGSFELSGSSLAIKGPGTLRKGLQASSGSNTLTITDGAVVGSVRASGSGTVLNVTGNVSSVSAGEGGTVNVTGNVSDVFVSSGGTVNITGNVLYRTIYVYDGGTVNVTGNVASEFYAVVAENSNVTIGGNVASAEFDAVIAKNSNVTINGNVNAGMLGIAVNGGTVTVNGTVSAVKGYIAFYIQVGDTWLPNNILAISDITTPTTKAGYFTYTDGESTVWVRDNAAAGNPYILAASPAWTGSGAAAWRIASEQFIALYRNSELVDPGNYETAAGSTIITLKESYIKTLGNGTHTFTAEFADIGNVNLVLTVSTGGGQLDSVPKTGEAMEESTATALLLIALVALVTAAAVAIITYKKKHATK